MLKFRCKHRQDPHDPKQDWIYAVVEKGNEPEACLDDGGVGISPPGTLHWYMVESTVCLKEWNGEPRFGLPRTGNMTGERVTDEEAEILTGLFMPAAMDRLRELVYAAGRD